MSAAVAALTREVGVPLVERVGRGVCLTRSGQTYADYARTILGLHDEALTAAQGDVDPERGRVRLAAVTTAGEHVLPAVLAGFRARYPGVALGLEVGTSERVWALLSSHEADLVIAGRPPDGLDGVVVHAIRPNELVVVAAPGVVEDFDLGRSTWLLREAGSGTHAICEALLAGLEVDPPTADPGLQRCGGRRGGGRTRRDPRLPRRGRPGAGHRGAGRGGGGGHTAAPALARRHPRPAVYEHGPAPRPPAARRGRHDDRLAPPAARRFPRTFHPPGDSGAQGANLGSPPGRHPVRQAKTPDRCRTEWSSPPDTARGRPCGCEQGSPEGRGT